MSLVFLDRPCSKIGELELKRKSQKKPVPVFETLDHEKYSPQNLKKASKSSNYQSIIADYPPLPKEEESTLFTIYRNEKGAKKERAFQILFLSNVYNIPYAIKKWRRQKPVDYDDLFQEGLLALVISIEKYDPKFGVRFSSYLTQSINWQLRHYTMSQHSMSVKMRWNKNRYDIYRAFKDEIRSAEFELNLESWMNTFSTENPHFPKKDINAVLLFLNYEYSRTLFLTELLPDINADVETTSINQMDLLRIYLLAKNTFPDPINQAIIEDIIFSDSPKTFSKLGAEFSITRQAAQQRHIRILRQIRSTWSVPQLDNE